MTTIPSLSNEDRKMLAALLHDRRPASLAARPTRHAPVPATLDLHGMTLAMAHTALVEFLAANIHAKRRKVMIITGKSGVLARDVPRWLTLTDLATMVTSVAPASPRQGGTGALMVSLKKHV